MSAEFTPYPCSLGEAIDHQADPAAYIVRTPDGRTVGIPANSTPSPENVEADIANPPEPAPEPTRIDSDTVLQRLTADERAALFTARRTVWQIDYFLTRASTTGIISSHDADLPAAQDMLADLGIIAADRWAALLAP